MKAHLQLLLVAIVFIVSFDSVADTLNNSSPEELGFSLEKLASIDAVMQSYIDDNRLADIDLLIAKKGKLVYSRTFSKENSNQIKHPLFRIASMTKPITSVAAMILVEEGKMALSDPISRYIPEFKTTKVLVSDSKEENKGAEVSKDSSEKTSYHLVSSERQITIKDLLTHTSGIIYAFMSVEHLSEIYHKNGVSEGLSPFNGTTKDNIIKLAKLPLKHQPGKHFTYGLSTDVLGYLVEVVANKPFGEFISDRILKPLDMSDTHFFLPKEKVARLVSLYKPKEKGGIEKYGDEDIKGKYGSFSPTYQYKGSMSYFSGGAGLVSSTVDYARFLQMMINRGVLDGIRILKKTTVDLMFQNHIQQVEQGDKNFRFGLGFMLHNKPVSPDVVPENSLSWGGIFHTSFWIDPANDLIAVSMAQKIPAPKSDVHDKFKQLVYEAMIDSR